MADLPPARPWLERLTFDPTGSYARPDVFHSTVRRERAQAVHVTDAAHGAAAEAGEDG